MVTDLKKRVSISLLVKELFIKNKLIEKKRSQKEAKRNCVPNLKGFGFLYNSRGSKGAFLILKLD